MARRWLKAFPGAKDSELWQFRLNAIMADEEQQKLYRQRLGDLSWLMRCLNEPLAKQSNREDC